MMGPSIIVVGCHGQCFEPHINIMLYFIVDQSEPNPKDYGSLFMVRNILWVDDNIDLVHIIQLRMGPDNRSSLNSLEPSSGWRREADISSRNGVW